MSSEVKIQVFRGMPPSILAGLKDSVDAAHTYADLASSSAEDAYESAVEAANIVIGAAVNVGNYTAKIKIADIITKGPHIDVRSLYPIPQIATAGVSNPLSGHFATLGQAQIIYPLALSLTDEIDWCVIQKAIGIGVPVYIPGGTYFINRQLTLSTVMIIGDYYKTFIRNNGVGNHGFYVSGYGCYMENIMQTGTSTTGSGIFLEKSIRFNNCEFSYNSRYGIEFTAVGHVISTFIDKVTIAGNLMGGSYIHSDGNAQKNVVSFNDCYITGNGNAVDINTAQINGLGSGIYVSGGIAITVNNTVIEYSHGAGLYLNSRGDYGLYGVNVHGCHFEGNRYANVLLDLANGSSARDIDINGNYYFGVSPYKTNSLIPSYGSRTVIKGHGALSNSNIDNQYGDKGIIPIVNNTKQSLRPGGDFESVPSRAIIDTPIVSNDPLSGGVSCVKLDASHVNYTDPIGQLTYVDPAAYYRLNYDILYNKVGTTSAGMYLLRYDRDNNAITGLNQGRTTPIAILSSAVAAGNTVLSFNDLSSWVIDPAATYRLQIYNYSDSTGYLYTDKYTRNYTTFNFLGSSLVVVGNNLTLPAAVGFAIASGVGCALRAATEPAGAYGLPGFAAGSIWNNIESVLKPVDIGPGVRYIGIFLAFTAGTATTDFILLRKVHVHRLVGIVPVSDVTASRPTVISNGYGNITVPIGYMFYDTTLGKPIWWNGTLWKDSAGVTV